MSLVRLRRARKDYTSSGKVPYMGKPCDGKDTFRATEGCQDPKQAARVPSRDGSCEYIPAIYEAGFCDCSDSIPRHLKCGITKKSCKTLCSDPPPVSTLPSAFENPVFSTKDTAQPTWISRHMNIIVASIIICAILVVVHVTRPVQNERRILSRLVRQQQKQNMIEAALSERIRTN